MSLNYPIRNYKSLSDFKRKVRDESKKIEIQRNLNQRYIANYKAQMSGRPLEVNQDQASLVGTVLDQLRTVLTESQAQSVLGEIIQAEEVKLLRQNFPPFIYYEHGRKYTNAEDFLIFWNRYAREHLYNQKYNETVAIKQINKLRDSLLEKIERYRGYLGEFVDPAIEEINEVYNLPNNQNLEKIEKFQEYKKILNARVKEAQKNESEIEVKNRRMAEEAEQKKGTDKHSKKLKDRDEAEAKAKRDAEVKKAIEEGDYILNIQQFQNQNLYGDYVEYIKEELPKLRNDNVRLKFLDLRLRTDRKLMSGETVRELGNIRDELYQKLQHSKRGPEVVVQQAIDPNSEEYLINMIVPRLYENRNDEKYLKNIYIPLVHLIGDLSGDEYKALGDVPQEYYSLIWHILLNKKILTPEQAIKIVKKKPVRILRNLNLGKAYSYYVHMKEAKIANVKASDYDNTTAPIFAISGDYQMPVPDFQPVNEEILPVLQAQSREGIYAPIQEQEGIYVSEADPEDVDYPSQGQGFRRRNFNQRRYNKVIAGEIRAGNNNRKILRHAQLFGRKIII